MAEEIMVVFVWTFVSFGIGYWIAFSQDEWKARQKQRIKQINMGKELYLRETWDKKK